MASEPGIELQTQLQSLAQRIVEAARVAASVHLFESHGESSRHYGRRSGIGGAGPVPPRDEAADSPAAPRQSPVTNDEPVAVATRDGAD